MGDFDGRAHVIALDRANGAIKWRTEIGRGGRIANHATPQSTPASDGESVFVMGPHGDFVALNANNGTIRWRKDVREEFGGRFMGNWGFAMSPLLDGDRIVVPVGGDGGVLVAFDKAGNLLWRTTDLPDAAAYTSVIIAEIGGIRQYVLLSSNYLAGISPTNGRVLWRAGFPGRTAVCSDPAVIGDVVIASSAYDTGAYFYRISREGDNFSAMSFYGPNQILQSHHGGIIAVGDHFYFTTGGNQGVRLLVCVEARTGNIVWRQAWNGNGSKGALTYVDGVLILRSETGDGTVVMVEATPEAYRELGRFDQPDRSNLNSWSYPVVVDNKLYLRDQNVLLVYDLN
jgi:outer membrane protein assembly factor BamB